ncbi:MAG: Flp family type IVb pilin [Xanthobacteraceae bacterium]|jgi:pilus assembly protein Flp/PilA|nr:Flp family type IVb pilin [Xanthobacteraceae bacterium]
MTKELLKTVRAFARNENGATAIEYALIAGGISIVILAAVISVGDTVRDDLFGKVATALGAGS